MRRAHLRQHVSSYHQKQKHFCKYPNCDGVYTARSSLHKHVLGSHKLRRFTCKYPGCVKIYTQLDSLNNHILAEHENYRWSCEFPKCAESFRSPKALAAHISSKHKNIRYKCSGCNHGFSRKASLKDHIKMQRCRPGVRQNNSDKIEFLEKHLASIDQQIGTLSTLISGFGSFECDECYLNK